MAYPWKGLQWSVLDFDNLSQDLLVVLLGFVLVAAYIVQKKAGIRAQGSPLPPGPKPWPLIGSLGMLGPLVHQDFARLSKKYGSVMLLRLGSINTIVISSPKAAQELLTKHDKVVAARPPLSQFQIMFYENESITMSSYGPYWRTVRKVFMMELMTARRLHQFQAFRKGAILDMLETLLDDCKNGNVLQMHERLSNVTYDSITRMAINKQYFGRDTSTANIVQRSFYINIIAEITKMSGAFVPGDYIPLLKRFDIGGYKKKMRVIRTATSKLFGAIVAEHRQGQAASADAKGFVDILLNPSITEDNKPLTDTQIQAVLQVLPCLHETHALFQEIVRKFSVPIDIELEESYRQNRIQLTRSERSQDVILAGTETSSTAAEWALAELLKNPSTLRRAQNELDEVVGRDRLFEESDIACLPYLHAVVKETFRLHPPVPLLLPRFSTEPYDVEGYHIPRNSLIFVNTWAIGRDPDVWSHASEFSPERFMGSSVDTAGQDFELLPFGSGRRACPGRPLGLLKVQYMLASLLHTFNWNLPAGSSPETLSMEEGEGTTSPRAVHLLTVASPRLLPAVLSTSVKSEQCYIYFCYRRSHTSIIDKMVTRH